MNGMQQTTRRRPGNGVATALSARPLLATLLGALLAGLPALPALSLPPQPDPGTLMASGQPVSSIPTADRAHGFQALDDAHVVLSVGAETHYLLTLGEQCFGLRWARHVGVTASDNTIWAGFDALTADGEACPIQAIHLVPEPSQKEF